MERPLSVWEIALKDSAIARLVTIEETRMGEPDKGHKLAIEIICTLLAELGYGDVGYKFQNTLWELEKAKWGLPLDEGGHFDGECECHYQSPYGFVVMAGCPYHDL